MFFLCQFDIMPKKWYNIATIEIYYTSILKGEILVDNKFDIIQKKKDLKKYEKLGALRFKKIVLNIERVKYKFESKFTPFLLRSYDKISDYFKKKSLNKVKSIEDKERISKDFICKKMLFHKQLNKRMNANYHMDNENPLEIIDYLKWNKKIHERLFKKNLVCIPLFVGISFINPVVGGVFFVGETFSLIINFECINLQNYNLTRLEIVKDKLIKKQLRQQQKYVEENEEAIELISEKINEKNDMLSFEDITNLIKNIDSREKLLQIKNMIEHDKIRYITKEEKVCY